MREDAFRQASGDVIAECAFIVMASVRDGSVTRGPKKVQTGPSTGDEFSRIILVGVSVLLA